MAQTPPAERMPWAAVSAAVDRDPPWRSTGTCPVAVHTHRMTRPRTPEERKYSLFATKVGRRGDTDDRTRESTSARWFGARITGPAVGTWCRPTNSGRVNQRTAGPTANHLRS